MQSQKKRQTSSNMKQKFLTASLIVLFLTIAVVASLLVFDYVRQITAASTSWPPFTMKPEEEENPEVEYEPGNPLPTWPGKERVNILVMGIDQRENEEGPWRTDTMMVLTIDPVTMSGGILSIPRDLWVPIPGYGEGRINTAHYLGDIDDYPGGGPALAAKTVQWNIGVPIHHYARVNFTAFEQIIDLIGGIDVYVEEEIDDPLYPDEAHGYDPLYIPAGEQHLDGETALKYARTRHSSGGDFDRARRQQKVLEAAFKKVTRLDMLPKLASQAPKMWRTLQDSLVVDPNLTLDEIIALAHLASQIDQEDIRYGVIDENCTKFYTTRDGQQVLFLLRDQMRELRDYVFTAHNYEQTPKPEEGEVESTPDTPSARWEDEDASIEVLNGTTRAGLAASTSDYLQEQGLEASRIANADRLDISESLVIVYTDKAYTAEYIIQLLDLPSTALVDGSNSGSSSEYDISIILGADYEPREP